MTRLDCDVNTNTDTHIYFFEKEEERISCHTTRTHEMAKAKSGEGI